MRFTESEKRLLSTKLIRAMDDAVGRTPQGLKIEDYQSENGSFTIGDTRVAISVRPTNFVEKIFNGGAKMVAVAFVQTDEGPTPLSSIEVVAQEFLKSDEEMGKAGERIYRTLNTTRLPGNQIA